MDIQSFDEMNLKDELLRGIYAYGFENPSAIQRQAILPMTQKKDLIAQAQSGTGKTGTFTIGSLQNIDISINICQVIILSPTRELSIQTNKVVNALGTYMNVTSYACIGGTNVRQCIQALKKGKQVVVGTPGRIYDMIQRSALSLEALKMFIIDEADDMLNLSLIHI